MNRQILPVAELARRARAGDLAALQQLRDQGFFADREAGLPGFPASHAQQRLWVIDRMGGGSCAYNMPAGFDLEGELDEAAFTAAFDAVIGRHEALRTTFRNTGSDLRQIVHDSGASLERRRLDALGDPEREVSELATRDAASPFDLERGPLLRASLLRTGKRRHAFLFNVHHIVCDGWSQGILIEDLSLAYRNALRCGNARLPVPELQYKDYAAWQRAWLKGPSATAERGYWMRALGAERAVTDLPTDHARPTTKSYAGATHSTHFDRGLTARLEALARRQGATTFMLLVALVKVVLHRYTGQRHILVGTHVAGRDLPELDHTVGFFVNTLVLRDRLSPRYRFSSLLDRVARTATAAYEHQRYPFDRLVGDVAPTRDPSRTPLFEIAINLDGTPRAALALPGVRIKPRETPFEAARYDLSFDFARLADGLRLDIRYDTGLFEAARIGMLARHLARAAAAIADEPQIAIGRLDLLSPQERHRLLHQLALGSTEAVPGSDLIVRFRAQAARTPGATALLDDGGARTYAAVDAEVNRLANHLRSLGAGPETLVGVCLGRSPELILALLASLAAGAGFVPLDPAYPARRLGYMLADAKVEIVLTDERHRARLPPTRARLVLIDRDRTAIEAWPADAPALAARPDQLAYLVYTSGSTGQPKGVQIERRGLANLGLAQSRAFDVGPGARVLQFASPSFDAAVSEIAMALGGFGATLCLATREALAPGPALAATIGRLQITHLTLPPSVLAVLPANALDGVRSLIVAGEPCPAQLARDWSRGRRLFNAYGPSESTVCATWGEHRGEAGAPPIGTPLANMRVYVLDQGLEPCPVGVTGELCIGGLGIARGYANRPGQTAERFVPDPHGETPGARLYRSGDLARYRQDGTIEFVGRGDDQVKIRGVRIEPGEIEAALAEHPSVSQAVVVARAPQDPARQGEDRRLVAYVVASGASGGDPPALAAALRRHLARTLPESFLPAAYVVLDTLPRAPSGKVDRRALPAPGPVQSASGYVAPRDALETVVAGVLGAVLGVERLGVEDDFFALGGHSLLAIQATSRLQETLRVELPLSVLFASPSASGVADALRDERTEKVARAVLRLRAMSDEEKCRLIESRRERNG
jgi:amino acid adenylation domain-containing protein